jgi:hypothetical protein
MSYEIISNEMKGILHINIANLNIQTWALFERLYIIFIFLCNVNILQHKLYYLSFYLNQYF